MCNVISSATAMLTVVLACGVMLMIPGIGESTAVTVGAAAAVAGWSGVMAHGKEQLAYRKPARLN